ncbi:Ig-like domain-containing protein, partial [Erythrobacter sp.]|uniref:T1SS-143 repeat domain-containing protein n=1 Tax=Erythrobacter sp. TaxID=1042 RepID=UPI00311F7FCA
MDYTGRGISEDGQENHDELSSELGRGPLVAMAQAGLAAEQTQIVGPDNVVRLPAGVSLDALAVDGRDLIITLEDGSVIRIPDGAIIVPQFEVDGVSVPPQNIAALLTGSEPEPAAGSVQSSGGNFAGDVGDIQDAYALGDLLPYTELSFPETREEEIFPGVVNDPPVIVIVTPDNPAGAIAAIASVDEAGLPARTVDGIAESAGTASETDVETTTGTIVFDAPDGAAAVLINDVAITAIGQTFVSPFGTLTITSIDLAGGRIGFSYTLADNLLGETVDGFFTMTIVDTDGDRASATLQIEVINDTPIARDDSAAQDSESAPVTVDVFANDTPGADGVALSTIQFVDGTLSGTGTLVNNGDGTFTYTPGPGEEGNVTFDYTITDGDNDTARATVTISLVPDTVPTGGLVTATVDDDGLVGGNPNSTTGDLDANVGDDAADTSEASFTGTLAFNVGVDAPASVAFDPALNGATATIGTEQVTYSLAGNVLTATGPRGVLFTVELTNAATGEYQVTLVDNVLHAGGPNDEAIDATTAIGFIVTDSDGDSVATTLNIVFDDDAPTAFDNVASVEEGGTVGGNLLSDGTDDVPGADGFAGIIGLTSINTESGTTTVVDGNLVIQGQYGTLTVNATTGVYSYVSTPNSTNTDATDTFTYTIVDGDGDTSTATLTVGIDNVAGNVSDNDALVNEAGLPGGSDSASNSEIANGQITVSDAVGPFVYTLTGSSDGTYGTLVLNEDTGAYTYTLDTPFTDGDTGENSRNVVNGADSFAYEVHDTAGNLIGSGTINVSIIDDIPDAVDELALAVVEGDPTGLSGNVIDNDVEGADGASVTSVNIDGTDYPVAAAGTTSVMTANGTYTFDALGNWTFAPSAGLDQTNGPIDASFTYTLTDTDDDFDTAKQPITINDGKDPSAGDPISLTVDDENLADGSDPATPVTDAASIVFTEGSDPIVSIIFDDTPTALDNLGGGLTWERVSDTQIVGRSGADTIVTLDLSVVGTTATVTVTLNDNYALHPNLGDDLAALGSVLVVATDLDGDQASSSVSVSVSDDLPTANAGVELTGSVDEDALPGGIEGGPGDIDGGAGTVGLTTGGSVATLFNSGADSPLTYAFETAASTQTYLTGLGLTSGGVALSYVVSAGSIVATAGGSPVFTMTLSSTGTWQFTLEGVLDHAGDDSEDDIDIDFGNLVVATDDDGDSVTGTGSLVVTVDDDTPTANAGVELTGSVDEDAL